MLSTSHFDTQTLAHPAQIEIYPPTRHDAHRPAVIAVHGEIDASNAHEIGTLAAILFAEQSDIIIDLSGVTFMGSRGLWTLTELPEVARAHGVGCAVVSSYAVDHLLQVIDRRRPPWVFDTADSALNAVAAEGYLRD